MSTSCSLAGSEAFPQAAGLLRVGARLRGLSSSDGSTARAAPRVLPLPLPSVSKGAKKTFSRAL